MPKNVDLAFVCRALSIFDGFSGLSNDDVWWRTDAPEYDPITLMVSCNDFFIWGSSDGEEITPENIEVLEQAVKDVEALTGGKRTYADLLFCARVSKLRPQGAYYKYLPKELWPLFDACGPVREAGLGNPEDRPAD